MKIVYITSRGGTVPVRKVYMDSLGADYQYVDHRLRWHDVPTPAWKKYLSWIVCAFTFPNRKKYDIFISSGQHYMPVLMKKMGLLRKNQKVACYQGNETLFFLKAGKYGKYTAKALRWQLKQYDAHICLSQLQAQLLNEVIGAQASVYCNFNGVEADRLAYLQFLQPALEKPSILFIGNLYAGWRLWYKGIDLLLSVYQKLRQDFPDLQLTIVGEVEEQVKAELTKDFPEDLLHQITFAGKVKNLKPYIEKSAVYLHLARGEAFGSAIIEAMAGGLIPVVSEWTGAKEAVVKVDTGLVVPLQVESAYEKIKQVLLWPSQKKEEISKNARKVILEDYTIDRALQRIHEVITTIGKQ